MGMLLKDKIKAAELKNGAVRIEMIHYINHRNDLQRAPSIAEKSNEARFVAGFLLGFLSCTLVVLIGFGVLG